MFERSFAEWGIFVIKSRLYRMLRGTLNHNWVDLLPKICEDYNKTPLKKLGWLKPVDINSIFDSYKVTAARKNHSINVYKEPKYIEQVKNQKLYEKNLKNLQKGSYVYLDFNESLFGKSFDVQVIL